MPLTTLFTINISVCLACLFIQAITIKKHTSHLLFALFCASVALATTQKLTGNTLGAYQYLIGMGACATCNAYWLLARSLFRKNQPFTLHHIILAVAIAALIMIKQGYLFAGNQWQWDIKQSILTKAMLSELTLLLSSTILVLSFWEGCRGFKHATKTEKAQRLLFLSAFSFAVVICKIAKSYYADQPQMTTHIIAFVTLFMLLNTQVLIFWCYSFPRSQLRCHKNQAPSLTTPLAFATQYLTVNPRLPEPLIEHQPLNQQDIILAAQMSELFFNQKKFLQNNLKVADIARELAVSEYRISHLVRSHLKGKSFNQFINQLRIEHAQSLLVKPNTQTWPILVIGLESGFASIGPFTRTFKAQTGFTPHQYRQQNKTLAEPAVN